MKTRYIVLLLALMCALNVSAQKGKTFAIKGSNTNTEVVGHNSDLENSVITIVNTSDKPIYLEWETVSNTFPSSWDCSMCQHGKCQIGIPKGSAFKKLDAGAEGFIAIHVLPQNQSGSGTVKFKIYDKDHPEYSEVLTFQVQVL